ncbi:MAG: CesT family type III secretion system chaperone [Puniceicoccales bacterium]|nr:CesT family type III secretion system chaperone [Puniceicoccales bacterium]
MRDKIYLAKRRAHATIAPVFYMTWEDTIGVLSEFLMVERWDREEDGAYSIVIDDAIDINFIPSSSMHIVFQGCFGEPLPTNNSAEAKLKQLLQWNFARIADNNDILSVDQKSRKISIVRKILLEKLSIDSLLDHVESFVRNVDFWLAAAEHKTTAAGLSPLLTRFHMK